MVAVAFLSLPRRDLLARGLMTWQAKGAYHNLEKTAFGESGSMCTSVVLLINRN